MREHFTVYPYSGVDEYRILAISCALVLAKAYFAYDYYGAWYDGPYGEGFTVHDPNTGMRRWSSELTLCGFGERTALVWPQRPDRYGRPTVTPVGYDLETGATRPAPPTVNIGGAFGDWPTWDASATAGPVTFSAEPTGGSPRTLTSTLWEVDFAEVLRPYRGDGRDDAGFTPWSIIPTDGRIYLVTEAG